MKPRPSSSRAVSSSKGACSRPEQSGLTLRRHSFIVSSLSCKSFSCGAEKPRCFPSSRSSFIRSKVNCWSSFSPSLARRDARRQALSFLRRFCCFRIRYKLASSTQASHFFTNSLRSSRPGRKYGILLPSEIRVCIDRSAGVGSSSRSADSFWAQASGTLALSTTFCTMWSNSSFV